MESLTDYYKEAAFNVAARTLAKGLKEGAGFARQAGSKAGLQSLKGHAGTALKQLTPKEKLIGAGVGGGLAGIGAGRLSK
jgi:hypothetical protein